MPRAKLKVRGSAPSSGGAYFPAETEVECISTGCKVLDCVLGGGIAEGRMLNLVGDRSTGKTLLAIEACANFNLKHADGSIFYRECEAAFDTPYAEALGLPVERVNMKDDLDTVEAFFEDIEKCLEKLPADQPALYVLDSLDALSDNAELNRKIGDASYGGNKAKQLSQVFRRIVRKLRKKRMTLIIISQVRDNIGVTFGAKHTRSGGKALDFYASQIIWLHQMTAVRRVVNKVERVIGVRIRAKCTKNKIGASHRECDFTIRFGYGVDDILSNVDFLNAVGRLNLLGIDDTPRSINAYLKSTNQLDDDAFAERRRRIERVVSKAWGSIEEDFQPTRRKYVT